MSAHTHLRRGLSAAAVVLFVVALCGAARFESALPSGVDVDEGLAPRPKWENTPSVEATFQRDSYRPGATAALVLWRREGALTLRIFRTGPEEEKTVGNITMNGVPVSPPLPVASHGAHSPIRVRIGDWPSGLYYARLRSSDGRIGFAPFVVRPRRAGEHRVLVALPTYTWQAYNFRDDDHDGRGDTWYAGWRQDWARIARPFLGRGVPPHFWHYDQPFLYWLAHTGRPAGLLSHTHPRSPPAARPPPAAH